VGWQEVVLVHQGNKKVEKSCRGMMPEILVVFGYGNLLPGINNQKREVGYAKG